MRRPFANRLLFLPVVLGALGYLLLSCTGKHSVSPHTAPQPLFEVWLDSAVVSEDQDSVELGVRVRCNAADADSVSVAGLSILLSYDRRGAVLDGLTRGPALSGWEYFTYRSSHEGDSTIACDSRYPSLVRLISLYSLQGGAGSNLTQFDGILARLKFRVVRRCPAQRVFDIRFFAAKPSDCMIASFPSVAYVPATDQTGLDFALDYDSLECSRLERTCEPVVDFRAGQIRFDGAPPLIPGDIDGDGRAMTERDARILDKFLLVGHGVFGPGLDSERAIAAGDANGDGVPLTVADLEYMRRIANGTFSPEDPTFLYCESDSVVVWQQLASDSGYVGVMGSCPVSAVWLQFSHAAGDSLSFVWQGGWDPPEELASYRSTTVTRVLIADWTQQRLLAPEYHCLVRVRGRSHQLISLDAAQASKFPGVQLTTQIAHLNGTTPCYVGVADDSH